MNEEMPNAAEASEEANQQLNALLKSKLGVDAF